MNPIFTAIYKSYKWIRKLKSVYSSLYWMCNLIDFDYAVLPDLNINSAHQSNEVSSKNTTQEQRPSRVTALFPFPKFPHSRHNFVAPFMRSEWRLASKARQEGRRAQTALRSCTFGDVTQHQWYQHNRRRVWSSWWRSNAARGATLKRLVAQWCWSRVLIPLHADRMRPSVVFFFLRPTHVFHDMHRLVKNIYLTWENTFC